MQTSDFRGVAFQAGCATRQSNRLLNKRAQLFRFRQSGYDAIVARVYQRRREVPQHRDAMLCGPPELPMGLKMTHGVFVLLRDYVAQTLVCGSLSRTTTRNFKLP